MSHLLADMKSSGIRKKQKFSDNTFGNVPTTAYLEVIGCGARGSPKSVHLFTNTLRYMFNVGEGIQRLVTEHKCKLSRLSGIFITHSSWDNLGGLPGILLCLRDINIKKVTLHGPPRAENLFIMTKGFMETQDIEIEKYDYHKQIYNDGCIQVEYVPIYPTTDFNQENAVSYGDMNGQNSCPIPHDLSATTDYSDHTLSSSTSDSLDINENNQKYKLKKLENTREALGDIERNKSKKPGDRDTVLAFIVKLADKPGQLNFQKCLEFKVPPNSPKLSQLKNGQDITLDDGTIVKSSDVLGSTEKGQSFAVIECPHVKYLNNLIQNTAFDPYFTQNYNFDHDKKSEKTLAAIVHFSPENIVKLPLYQDWIAKFGPHTTHIYINDGNNDCLSLLSPLELQTKLNCVDSRIFPTPIINKFDPTSFLENDKISQSLFESKPVDGIMTEKNSRKNGNNSAYNNIYGKPLDKFYLRPYKNNTVNVNINENNVMNINENYVPYANELILDSNNNMNNTTDKEVSEILTYDKEAFMMSLTKAKRLIDQHYKASNDQNVQNENNPTVTWTSTSQPIKIGTSLDQQQTYQPIKSDSTDLQDQSINLIKTQAHDPKVTCPSLASQPIEKGTDSQNFLNSSCPYPEFIFLGTGSAVPNKTRNVSAIWCNLRGKNDYINHNVTNNETNNIKINTTNNVINVTNNEINVTNNEINDVNETKNEINVTKNEIYVTNNEINVTNNEINTTNNEINVTNNQINVTNNNINETNNCKINTTNNEINVNNNEINEISMLLDCGEGTFGQMVRFFGFLNQKSEKNEKNYQLYPSYCQTHMDNAQINRMLNQLICIYISHLHADHHLGLLQFIIERKKIFKNNNINNEKILIIGPKSLLNFYRPYSEKHEEIMSEIEFIPIHYLVHNSKHYETTADYICGKLNLKYIETVSVYHYKQPYGLIFVTENDRKIVYSGDTLPCETLINRAQKSYLRSPVSLLIHEATMENDLIQEAFKKRHSTVDQAIQVGQNMGSKFTLLTHFSQRYSKIPMLPLTQNNANTNIREHLKNNANIVKNMNNPNNNGEISIKSSQIPPRITDSNCKNVGIAFDNMRVSFNELETLPYLLEPLGYLFAPEIADMKLRTSRLITRKNNCDSEI